MTIEKTKGTSLSRVVDMPLIIVGKPGKSKSLSFQILFNTMKGK